MTDFELMQLRPLRAEVEMDIHRLEVLEQESGAARCPELIQDIRQTIEAKLRRCMAQLDALERWLTSVPDDFIRELLTLHYVNGLPWKQVALQMGGGNTSDNLRMAASRYLKRKSV